MEQGFILLNANLIRSRHWCSHTNVSRLFFQLLLEAKRQHQNGDIPPKAGGDMVTDIFYLSRATGLSVNSVKACLRQLKKYGEIETDFNNGVIYICIINFKDYCGKEPAH